MKAGVRGRGGAGMRGREGAGVRGKGGAGVRGREGAGAISSSALEDTKSSDIFKVWLETTRNF